MADHEKLKELIDEVAALKEAVEEAEDRLTRQMEAIIKIISRMILIVLVSIVPLSNSLILFALR